MWEVRCNSQSRRRGPRRSRVCRGPYIIIFKCCWYVCLGRCGLCDGCGDATATLCDIPKTLRYLLRLDAGLGEGHPEVVGLRQLVVVHLDESRHRVVDGWQLDQRHFAVLPEIWDSYTISIVILPKMVPKSQRKLYTYGKNLKALIANPRLVKASLISSSDTVALKTKHPYCRTTWWHNKQSISSSVCRTKYLRNVRQVESRARWVNVLVVFAARLLESVQGALGIVPGKYVDNMLSG